MENENADFLGDQVEGDKGSCDLQRLSDMCDAFTLSDDAVIKLEEQLKEAKAERTRLSQETIPNYLNLYGLSELRLADGRKVIVSDDVSVTVKDVSTFHNWLKLRNEDSIIKFNVSFKKMDPSKRKAFFDYILEQDFDCDTDESVHSATRKKYFKELLGIGMESGKIASGLSSGTMVTPDKVEGFAKVFSFKKTKIKR